MDTLTHALSGALLGRATAPRTPGPHTLSVQGRMLAGAAAAAFPDIDFVTNYLSPLSYLYHHRGVTHSILLIPAWAIVLAMILALLSSDRRNWRAYLGISAIGIAAHIAGDLITSYGTMVFAPLSDARYALSATFIIDLWFTGILFAGFAACFMWRSSRVPAIAGLAVVAGYVGFQVGLQHRAIDFGEAYARARGIERAAVTAMPRPVSPFNWTVFVTEDTRYHYAHVNLFRKAALPEPGAESGFIRKLDAPYRPLDDTVWAQAERYGGDAKRAVLAKAAFAHPEFRFFRWFALYPALMDARGANEERCFWFHDLRFVTPGRGAAPFRYGMCRDETGGWLPFQLLGGKTRRVY